MAQNAKAGDANQITRDYFDSLLIEMRHIDAVKPNTELSLFGETFSTPIMTAALSHLNGCHPDGMVELARGAAAAHAVLWTGMGDETELEAITATGARSIKIIKPHADNAVVLRRIRHAEQCGVFAMGMDIDHAFNGQGDYDTVLGLPMKPKSQEELKTFIAATKLPFVIKGVLSVQDALKCVAAGAAGIVVSHHHGILPYAVPPLLVLPKIVDAVKGRMKIFVDCGVESGIDALKALALGADAVCVGRALMGPLSDNGAQGVRDAIAAMTAELAGAMARTACGDVEHIDPSLIWTR